MPTARSRLRGATAVALLALPAPVASPPTASAAFSPGIVANGGADHAAQDRALVAGQQLGATRIRMGFTADEPLAVVREQRADAAARGMEIIPVLEADGPGPSAAHAANVARWVRELGPGGPGAGAKPIRFVEFGNENSYNGSNKAGPSGGRAYANRYRAYYDAINSGRGNRRVGLLAQADDGGTGRFDWVRGMKAAQPRICRMVADRGGWSMHAYGPMRPYHEAEGQGEDRWRGRLRRLVADTSRIGCSTRIPIDVTEDGIASRDGRPLFAEAGKLNPSQDNFGWRRNLTYAEAADGLRQKVAAVRGMGRIGKRIRHYLLFQAMDNKSWTNPTDHREAWWGAVRADYGTKGELTAAARWLMRR